MKAIKQVLDTLQERVAGPGWRNALDAADCPVERAACYLWAARGASSRAAAWQYATCAVQIIGIEVSELGTGRWPNQAELEAIIERAAAAYLARLDEVQAQCAADEISAKCGIYPSDSWMRKQAS